MAEEKFDDSGLKIMKEFLEKYGWKLDGELYPEVAAYYYDDDDENGDWAFRQDISCTLSDGTDIGFGADVGRYDSIKSNTILFDLYTDIEHCLNYSEGRFFEVYIDCGFSDYTPEEEEEGDKRLKELYDALCDTLGY